MTTPTRTEIEQCARNLWHRDRARSGDPSFYIEPELNELRESGYLSSARSELMTTKNEKWINSVSETSTFTVDIEQLFESNGLILGSRHTGKSDIAMILSDKAMLEKAVVVVFDPSQDWIARSSIRNYVKVNPYMALGVPSESVIYDVSLCSPLDQQRIVENFSKKLFEYQASNPERKQYLVIFEEAHTNFTQGCMRSENLANCVRLLSVGRNVGIACVLLSQFASMLDKFAIKHLTSQAWFGFTREPNDLKYLRQILGSEVEKLSKLSDGEFVCLTRHGVSKIRIEPYEATIQKQEITIPQCAPIEPTQPIRRNQSTGIGLAKLAVIAIFAILTIGALR